jgi:hypothetical protein
MDSGGFQAKCGSITAMYSYSTACLPAPPPRLAFVSCTRRLDVHDSLHVMPRYPATVHKTRDDDDEGCEVMSLAWRSNDAPVERATGAVSTATATTWGRGTYRRWRRTSSLTRSQSTSAATLVGPGSTGRSGRAGGAVHCACSEDGGSPAMWRLSSMGGWR